MAERDGDFIQLKGLNFVGHHGVLADERRQGQAFRVDLRLFADLRAAGETDDLLRTIDYAAVYAATQAVMEGPPLHLVEALAQRLAEELLTRFPVEAVRVRVTKLAASLAPGVGAPASVSILRERARA